MVLTGEQSNVLISWSIVIGLTLVVTGIVTNKLQSGRWSDYPWNFSPLACWVYFSGPAVFLAACSIAKVFSVE